MEFICKQNCKLYKFAIPNLSKHITKTGTKCFFPRCSKPISANTWNKNLSKLCSGLCPSYLFRYVPSFSFLCIFQWCFLTAIASTVVTINEISSSTCFTLGGDVSLFLWFEFCLLLFKEPVCRTKLYASLLSQMKGVCYTFCSVFSSPSLTISRVTARCEIHYVVSLCIVNY